jgi:outer membrane protein OmpA-like peptidoglycan-associated protein
MKTIILASLLVPAIAFADSPTRGPDFVRVAPRGVDRTVVASDGLQPIEPLELVMFDLDSIALDPIALTELETLAHWMKQFPEQHLVLAGHTDILGTHAYNMELGKRRAEAVRDYLASWGVSSDRIVVASFGKRNAHAKEHPGDRNVVVFASDRPVKELAAAMLDSTRAKVVAWSDRGTKLETEKGI